MKNFLIKFLVVLSGALVVNSTYAQSNTVPVIYINTENGQEVINKEDKVPATLYVDPCESSYEALGSKESPISFTLSGRGNYTWTGFNKKPYKVKFDKKQEILGLPKGKNFALLAHADDNMSFLRNTIGFELSRRLGLDWTPTQIPVEVVYNGKYHGLYFLTETIKVDSKRVNITEQEDLNTDPSTVGGGWIVEIDNYNLDPHVEIQEGSGYTIYFTYKSPEELSPLQEEYLTSQMKAINAAIYSSDKNSTDWEELIDIESAARYYVVQEILDDCESYHGSCYLTHDLGEGAKWKFGPVWDFGNTYQRNQKSWIWDRPLFHQVWIGELYKFPRFQQKVKEVWKEFCEDVYPDIAPYVDNFIDNISAAGVLNNERWPEYGNKDLVERSNVFKTMFNSSVDWLSSKWDYAPVKPLSIYVRGTFNNWGISNPMSTSDGNIYTATIAAITTNDEFKIATEDWKTVDFGAPREGNKIFYLDQTNIMEVKGANITPDQDLYNIPLTFNLEDGTLYIGEYKGNDDNGGNGDDNGGGNGDDNGGNGDDNGGGNGDDNGGGNGESGVANVYVRGLEIDGGVISSEEYFSVYTLSGMSICINQKCVELPSGGVYIIVSPFYTGKIRCR